MTTLVEEASLLQDFIDANGWDYYFIGGIAVQVWGEPRLTRDLDLTIFTNLENEPEFIQTILTKYRPKFAGAAKFALTNRILPVFAVSGIPIDIALGGFADISEPLRRSSFQEFSDRVSLKICSADDLLILKTIAGRPRDWPDIEAVIIKQRLLDWDYIESSLSALMDYEDLTERIAHLLTLREKYYQK